MSKVFRIGGVEDNDPTSDVIIDPKWLDIGHDLDADSRDIAANIGKLADVRADRLQKLEVGEATLTQWKASFSVKKLTQDAKLAEWKVKEMYRAESHYMTMKRYLAEVRADLSWVDDIMNAYQIKARVIDGMRRADGQEKRTTRAGIGGATGRAKIPAAVRAKPDDDDDDDDDDN